MKTLTIGIDYDDTFTADPVSWSAMIRLFRGNGHRFFLVTARRETEQNVDEINTLLDHWDCQMPIVFAKLGSKLFAVKQRGIKIDIWIDDDPEKLVHGH